MAKRQSSSLIKAAPRVPARVLADRVVGKLRDAEKALQFATTIHQAKVISDIAAAQELFAHRQRLGEEVIGYAHQIKIHALAKLGELVRELPKSSGVVGRDKKGMTRGSSGVPRVGEPATYAELGLDKKTASVSQRLASLPMPLLAAIASREQSLTQVSRQVKATEIKRRVSLPDAKYRVIYADPPWSYGNTQPDYHTEQRDHYPVMPLADICALPVQELVEDDSVLFLWVTSPILEESFRVVSAWGFKYKASFVWDKVKHNMGHYNSVRHEFVLVCVRGSCQPDQQKLFDSVITEERTQHSVKPAIFYEMIETLYPNGKRLELFARTDQPRHGWDVYGFEATA